MALGHRSGDALQILAQEGCTDGQNPGAVPIQNTVGLNESGGPVATRTPEIYRVKVAFLIPICFQAPKY
jgi:hypothetical protein